MNLINHVTCPETMKGKDHKGNEHTREMSSIVGFSIMKINIKRITWPTNRDFNISTLLDTVLSLNLFINTHSSLETTVSGRKIKQDLFNKIVWILKVSLHVSSSIIVKETFTRTSNFMMKQ